MTEQSIQTYEEDEISLLDIAVTLAESWRLLVLGPLIAGVLAFGLSFLWPKTYESVAILRVTEADLALLNTSTVLDSLIEKFGLLSEFNGIREDARQYLTKKLVAKVDKKTGLATITAIGSESEMAQELCKAAIDALKKELLPKGKSKSEVLDQILYNDRAIASLHDAIDQLQKQIGKSGRNEANLDVVMKHYFALSGELANKQLQNSQLKNSLEPRGDELFVQQPSLPQIKASPKRSSFVVLGIVFSSFALLLFVFVRKAIALAAQDPEVSIKLRAIRTAFGNRPEC